MGSARLLVAQNHTRRLLEGGVHRKSGTAPNNSPKYKLWRTGPTICDRLAGC